MKQVSAVEILEWLSDREARGHHIDNRLSQAVRAQGKLSVFTLTDEQSYLSLIWQEIDPTRLLTPHGQPGR
jgi:hypothetical protein